MCRGTRESPRHDLDLAHGMAGSPRGPVEVARSAGEGALSGRDRPPGGSGGFGVPGSLLGLDGRVGALSVDLDANLLRRTRADLRDANGQQPVLDRGLRLVEPAVARQGD